MAMTCQSWVNEDVFSLPFQIRAGVHLKQPHDLRLSPLVISAGLHFLWLSESPVPPWPVRIGPWWRKLTLSVSHFSISDDSSAWKWVKVRGRVGARCLCTKCNSTASKPCFLLLVVSMELLKQNQRKKPGQVTAASCWFKMVYVKWVISSLLYIWLWKYESFSAWGSSMFYFSVLYICAKISGVLLRSHWRGDIGPCDWLCLCVVDETSAVCWQAGALGNHPGLSQAH